MAAPAGLARAWASPLATLLLFPVVLGVAATTLSRENFWLDELSSLYFSDPARSVADMLRELWRSETNPPLYYVYLYAWRQVVPGADEASIRAASLIPAALACLSPLLYSGVMRLERRLAVVLLLSFSPGLLYYAVEARGYGLLLLLSVNMCFLLLSALQALRANDRKLGGTLALLAALSAAAGWTHLFGTLLAAVFFFVLLLAAIVLRRRILLVGSVGVATAIAVTVWPLTHLIYMSEIAGDHWFISLSREALITETKWIGHLAFGNRLSVLAFAGLTLGALAYAWNPRTSNKEILCLCLLLFVGLVLGLSLKIPIYYARYFLILLPAIYILVVEAVGDAAQRLGGRAPWIPLGLVLLLVPALVPAWPVLEPPEREDWRAAASVLNGSPECAGAPIFAIASGEDSGDPVHLYGHYLDPALGIQIIPVRASESFDATAFARVWQSPCAVKVWGAHMELWQLRALASHFAALPSGFQLLPFRSGFLLLAGSGADGRQRAGAGLARSRSNSYP